jgi:glycine/D-amino acid oxidase-like deaminating enzyme
MRGIPATDVVVIGGGCIGLASAIALAGRGTKVTLVERGLPGAANSTLHGGGIRQQFGTELNIRLSQLSAEIWDQFAERYGVDPLFRPIGYLFLARTEEEAATLAGHVRLQHSLGVDSEFLDADEIARRWPALSGRGFRGAGFRAADAGPISIASSTASSAGRSRRGSSCSPGPRHCRSSCPAAVSPASRPLLGGSPSMRCSSRPDRGSSLCWIP